MKPIAISVCCCVAAAAEIAAQQTPSICMDPPPQSHNATLNAVVERALASLAAPSLSYGARARYREAHPHSEVARPALVRIVTPDDPLDDLRRLKPAVIRCGLATLSDRPAWARPARDAQVVDP